MSYNVKTIPKFDKSNKKLAKKYPSLKSEFISLVQSLKEDPEQGIRLATVATKYGLPLLLKVKAKAVVPG